MNLQTTDLLKEIEFVDDIHLKRLYNYNLATNRNNYEAMVEVREEFFKQKSDPEVARMWSRIAKSTSIAA